MNEPNESKVANLLATLDDLATSEEKIELLVEVIEEQEKAFQKLRKQFEDHELFSPEFLRKEAEFQKHMLEAQK